MCTAHTVEVKLTLRLRERERNSSSCSPAAPSTLLCSLKAFRTNTARLSHATGCPVAPKAPLQPAETEPSEAERREQHGGVEETRIFNQTLSAKARELPPLSALTNS